MLQAYCGFQSNEIGLPLSWLETSYVSNEFLNITHVVKAYTKLLCLKKAHVFPKIVLVDEIVNQDYEY